MRILGAIVVFIQFCFAVHVVKTGRPNWWLFVIMGFPVGGCCLYYFIEVFPTTRESRAAEKTIRAIARSLDPEKELRARVANLETCGSVANRIALAQECIARGMIDEAEALYRSCLGGVHANDSDVLFGHASALVMKGDYQGAMPVLERLVAQAPNYRPGDVHMCLGESYEGMGEFDRALAEFANLAETYSGEKGRWHYGALLKRMGRTSEAQDVFRGMLQRAERMPEHYRDEQKQWLTLARDNLA